jgi:hypothetical protein
MHLGTPDGTHGQGFLKLAHRYGSPRSLVDRFGSEQRDSAQVIKSAGE